MRLVQAEGWEVIPWWKPGLFSPGKTVFAVLTRLAPSLDAAILVFSDDDKVWFRGNPVGAPRDNVLIEYGLFTGVVGGTEDDRVIICRIGDPKGASDLAGIIYIQFDPAKVTSFVEELKPWLESVKTRSAEQAYGLARVYTTNLRKELFLSGEQVVRSATSEIVLCARTPVPFVGTRPYDDSDDPSDHEKTQLDAYESAIMSLYSNDRKRITIIGCIDSLSEDIKAFGNDFQIRVRTRLNDLYSHAAKLNGRLSLRWSTEPNLTTFVTGDADVIVWFKNIDAENVWFHCSNPDFAKALKQHARRASQALALNDLESRLGLENAGA